MLKVVTVVVLNSATVYTSIAGQMICSQSTSTEAGEFCFYKSSTHGWIPAKARKSVQLAMT